MEFLSYSFSCNHSSYIHIYIFIRSHDISRLLSTIPVGNAGYCGWLGYFHVYRWLIHVYKYSWNDSKIVSKLCSNPYPEPVCTRWASVHWNATGWPSVHWDATGPPSDYLQGTLEHHGKKTWNCPTLECHWRNFDNFRLHWNTTGKA